jgi:hypothetical protein
MWGLLAVCVEAVLRGNCVSLRCCKQVLQKRRMQAAVQAWFTAAAGRREKRLAMARAGRFWAKQQLGKAWNSW